MSKTSANNHLINRYELFATLLEYPGAGIVSTIGRLQEELSEAYPKPAEDLQTFADAFKELALQQQEELYIHTFDVQAFTTMDVGYVLFGEDYKRGKLLVNLNREHRHAGVDCKGQLADYLPNILRLISRMENETLKAELVHRIVIPALHKIRQDFHPEKIQKKQKLYKKHQKTLLDDPVKRPLLYSVVFDVLTIVLQSDFRDAMQPQGIPGEDYAKDIHNEMKNQ
ncbi:MAG: hypothetical protein K9I74_13665 [Bacteroidales bacterium]|nr:hypothetical protein [Bacteroidales bacterium]